MQMAISHPEKVNKLINVASSPSFVARDVWPGMEFAVLQNFHDSLQKDYHKTLDRFLRLQFLNLECANTFFKQTKAQLSQRAAPGKQALLGGLNILETTDFRAEVSKLKCDSLWLLGRLDALVPARVKLSLSQLTSGDIKVIAKAGHMPFITHETLFIQQLEDFLHEPAEEFTY